MVYVTICPVVRLTTVRIAPLPVPLHRPKRGTSRLWHAAPYTCLSWTLMWRCRHWLVPISYWALLMTFLPPRSIRTTTSLSFVHHLILMPFASSHSHFHECVHHPLIHPNLPSTFLRCLSLSLILPLSFFFSCSFIVHSYKQSFFLILLVLSLLCHSPCAQSLHLVVDRMQQTRDLA